MKIYRLARSKTIFDVTLENDSVRLGESERLIHRNQSIAIWSESRKDGGIDRTAIVVNDGERGSGILGHGNAAPSENAIRSLVRNFDSERQAVADSHRFNLLTPRVEDTNLGRGRLGCRGDANHVGVPDGHHAEGYVARGRIVRASDFVDFVGLRHDNTVPLNDHGVGVNASHGLSVTILPGHGQVQSERVAVNDIDVARFRSSQGINSAAEWFVGVDIDHNSSVFTMHAH